MGSKTATDIQINGKWFAKVEEGDSKSALRYTNKDAGEGDAIEKSTSYGKQGLSQQYNSGNQGSAPRVYKTPITAK